MTQAETYFTQIKEHNTVSNLIAREAIIGSFIHIHQLMVQRSEPGFDFALSSKDVEITVRNFLKSILADSYNNPSKKDLQIAKTSLEEKLLFHKIPYDLRQLHNSAFKLILSKIS